MMPYVRILIALLSTASVGLAQAPHAAIVTGEVHNPPSREIEFRHEPLLAPGPSQHHIVLGLHSAADEAPPAYSLTFSGRGANNNRFLAEFWPQHSAFEPDYELEPEEFARQVEQQRRDELALLAEGREQYALSSGFIDCMTDFINYNWADKTVSYPQFLFKNGVLMRRYSTDPSHRKEVPPDYYDFLQEIPLIDEKAIGVQEYRWFLVNTLDLDAKSDGPPRLADRYKLSGLGLSPAVHAQLDSMYDANRDPRLSQMIDLAGLGLTESAQVQLDSMYADPKEMSASQKAAWLGLELSPAALPMRVIV